MKPGDVIIIYRRPTGMIWPHQRVWIIKKTALAKGGCAPSTSGNKVRLSGESREREKPVLLDGDVEQLLFDGSLNAGVGAATPLEPLPAVIDVEFYGQARQRTRMVGGGGGFQRSKANSSTKASVPSPRSPRDVAQHS